MRTIRRYATMSVSGVLLAGSLAWAGLRIKRFLDDSGIDLGSFIP